MSAACAGGSSPGDGDGDGDGPGVGGSAPIIVGGGGSDNSGTGGTSGGLVTGGTSGGDGNCQPTTCEAQGKNCGIIVDGCGSTIDCGGCSDGLVCGLVEENVCASTAEACVPLTQEQVCEGKQCGLDSDGCGNTVDCGTCPSGQGCGIQEAFQCDVIVGGSATDCAARIESCAEVGARCGIIGNGCGGTIDCTAELGACPSGELCGVIDAQQCGVFAACQPLDPEDACDGHCGQVSNGCGPDVGGGVIDCQTTSHACTGGDTCGGGGVPDECGQGGIQACTPIPQNTACGSAVCGFASNGCGGSYDCSGGNGCADGFECKAGQCVAPPPSCSPKSKATQCAGKECGVVSDGCVGTYDCGSCSSGQQCGVINAFQCDVPPGQGGCVPRTQLEACAGKECGTALDGCGTAPSNQINCGSTCPNGQYCGVKEAFQCDTPPAPPACVPNGQTCQNQGWACGTFVNNCGTTSNCGSCNATQTCMGGLEGNPTTCVSVAGDDDEECALCDAVPSCSGQGQLTRLTGRVITPAQTDVASLAGNRVRVPNAFVYILRNNDLADLPAIVAGLPANDTQTACDRCVDQDLGPVLAGDVTDANGNWEIAGNIPVGQEFILVTKIGKFRRAQRMTLPGNRACQTTALPQGMSEQSNDTAGSLPTHDNPTRLPRTMSDGLGVNIPRMAVTTGAIDAMECVFYKMGLESSVFGNFGGSNRVDLYRGGPSGNQGAQITGGSPADSTLYNDLTRLEAYDMVVSDCEGGGWDSNFSQRNLRANGTAGTAGADDTRGGKVRQYVNRGGRMFLSHLSFSWLHQNGSTGYSPGNPIATSLGQTSTWFTGLNTTATGTGVVSIVGNRPRVSPRIDTFATWVDAENVAHPAAYQFPITDPRSQNNTIAAGTEEFVYDIINNVPQRVQQFSFNTPFGAPTENACGRVAYSGFHVAATVGQGTTPFTGQNFPDHCTSATLGNGGILTAQEKILLFMLFDLGTCVGDEPDPPECDELECPSNACGSVPNGCGGTMNCGGCPGGQVCDNNVCRPQCVPTTCEAEGVVCSTIADGCGGSLTCSCNGVCDPLTLSEACAGNQCGYVSDGCSGVHFCGNCSGACTPLTACPQGIDCGIISDGCNGVLNCGSCATGYLCGAHDANQCDPPTCRPLTCYEANAGCGMVGDGCGGAIQCGTCPPGQICTVAPDGTPNQCLGCTPKTQNAACAGLECGVVGDGCGGILNCGNCTVQGEVCGAIAPNMCDPGATCTPLTCPSGAECGLIGDGCGNTVSCGTCPVGEVCGLNEPYQCAGCTPRTCATAGANCGIIGDGCGGQLDCGQCTPGYTCGLGQPNKCGQIR